MAQPKLTKLTWDWKRGPSIEELKAALEPFGVVIVEDPGWANSDQYGYVLSDRALTPRELKSFSESEW